MTTAVCNCRFSAVATLSRPSLHRIRVGVARVRGLGLVCMLLVSAMALAGCAKKEEMVPASIRGYSHNIEFPIYNFTVNGRMGSNVSQDGGGKTSCCVSLPQHWRPGLMAHIVVEYDTDQGGPEPPPPRSFDVPVEPYTPEGMGALNVHFYPNGKVRAVSTRYGIGHPRYPRIEGAEPDPDFTRFYCTAIQPSDQVCREFPMPPAPPPFSSSTPTEQNP